MNRNRQKTNEQDTNKIYQLTEHAQNRIKPHEQNQAGNERARAEQEQQITKHTQISLKTHKQEEARNERARNEQ